MQKQWRHWAIKCSGGLVSHMTGFAAIGDRKTSAPVSSFCAALFHARDPVPSCLVQQGNQRRDSAARQARIESAGQLYDVVNTHLLNITT